jgi:CDGSH-type Zn-finger protein
MSEAKVASRTPFGIDVEEGRTYWWCSCGQSKNQPFCDGSHKGSSFTPVKFEAKQTGKAWFCGCKQSANAPLCDGAHKRLP